MVALNASKWQPLMSCCVPVVCRLTQLQIAAIVRLEICSRSALPYFHPLAVITAQNLWLKSRYFTFRIKWDPSVFNWRPSPRFFKKQNKTLQFPSVELIFRCGTEAKSFFLFQGSISPLFGNLFSLLNTRSSKWVFSLVKKATLKRGGK